MQAADRGVSCDGIRRRENRQNLDAEQIWQEGESAGIQGGTQISFWRPKGSRPFLGKAKADKGKARSRPGVWGLSTGFSPGHLVW